MSDHSVLKFNLRLFIDRVPTKDKFTWDKGDYSKLCALLDINWDDVLDVSSATVDKMWDKFKFTLLDGMQAFIPKRNQRSRNNKKNYQPFSAELKQMIHKNIDYENVGLYLEMLLFMTSTKNSQQR